MNAFVIPAYMVDFTPKTVRAILSPAGIGGTEVDIDVYDRTNMNHKLEAKGTRLNDQKDNFRITVEVDGVINQHDWNFTILRESAGRSRKSR